MSSSMAKTKKSQSDQIQPCKRCLVLQRTAGKDLLSEMSIKAGLATIYTSDCLRATSVTILKRLGFTISELNSVTAGHKSDSSVIVSEFASRCTQCQFSKERALMKIQQNLHVWRNPDFKCRSASTFVS